MVDLCHGVEVQGTVGGDLALAVDEGAGEKCERCWMHHTKVGSDTEHPNLCPRCSKVIRTIQL